MLSGQASRSRDGVIWLATILRTRGGEAVGGSGLSRGSSREPLGGPDETHAEPTTGAVQLVAANRTGITPRDIPLHALLNHLRRKLATSRRHPDLRNLDYNSA